MKRKHVFVYSISGTGLTRYIFYIPNPLQKCLEIYLDDKVYFSL